MDTANESAGASKNQKGLRNKIDRDATKQIVIIVVIGLVLLAVVWIWKSIEIRNIKNYASTEKNEIQAYVTNQTRQSHEMHLKLFAKPFVWAIRIEMLNNDIRQVRLYVNDMVQEKYLQKIAITNSKGIVIVSTNKKEEGKEFISIGNPLYLIANNTMIDKINDTLMIMSSPIMGFNSRLGTLIVTYSFQPLDFK